jgi:hypothetical protein
VKWLQSPRGALALQTGEGHDVFGNLDDAIARAEMNRRLGVTTASTGRSYSYRSMKVDQNVTAPGPSIQIGLGKAIRLIIKDVIWRQPHRVKPRIDLPPVKAYERLANAAKSHFVKLRTDAACCENEERKNNSNGNNHWPTLARAGPS